MWLADAAKPITPAVRTTPDQRLVCYQATLAPKLIARTGCGPTTSGDKGTTISARSSTR